MRRCSSGLKGKTPSRRLGHARRWLQARRPVQARRQGHLRARRCHHSAAGRGRARQRARGEAALAQAAEGDARRRTRGSSLGSGPPRAATGSGGTPLHIRDFAPRGWSVYGAQQAQPVASTGKSAGRRNRGIKPNLLPWVATGCRGRQMVRRGSTVRVRQRALYTGTSCCLSRHDAGELYGGGQRGGDLQALRVFAAPIDGREGTLREHAATVGRYVSCSSS
jgi:hypothetical protein